jgi:hypothetical protein
MFLGTSRGPGGVAADGEADALRRWTGFELFIRAEWIITAANETREMPAWVVQKSAVSGHQVRTAPGAVGMGRVYRNLMNRRTLAAAAGVALVR